RGGESGTAGAAARNRPLHDGGKPSPRRSGGEPSQKIEGAVDQNAAHARPVGRKRTRAGLGSQGTGRAPGRDDQPSFGSIGVDHSAVSFQSLSVTVMTWLAPAMATWPKNCRSMSDVCRLFSGTF